MKQPKFKNIPIDRVDYNDKVIGLTTYNELKKNKKIGYRLCAIFTINSRGQILMQKRSPWINNPNMWDTRSGGMVDSKETYLQAARRELKEELGINVPKNRIKLIAKIRRWNKKDKHQRRYYVCYFNGTLKPNPNEVSDYRFVDIDKVTTFTKEKLKPGGIRDLKILKQWLRKQQNQKK